MGIPLVKRSPSYSFVAIFNNTIFLYLSFNKTKSSWLHNTYYRAYFFWQSPRYYYCTIIILVNRQFHQWKPDCKTNWLSNWLIITDYWKHLLTRMSSSNYLCFHFRKGSFSLQFRKKQNSTIRKRYDEANETIGTYQKIIYFVTIHLFEVRIRVWINLEDIIIWIQH